MQFFTVLGFPLCGSVLSFFFGISFLSVSVTMAPKAVEAHQKGGKSRAEKKPVKAKVEKKPLKEGGKKKKAKKSTETYKIYIYKVLKQVCGFEAFATLRMCVWFWLLFQMFSPLVVGHGCYVVFLQSLGDGAIFLILCVFCVSFRCIPTLEFHQRRWGS